MPAAPGALVSQILFFSPFLQELPIEVRLYLNKCGLTDSNIRQHFGMVMAIVQFVGKIRVDNPWKDEQKKKTGAFFVQPTNPRFNICIF